MTAAEEPRITPLLEIHQLAVHYADRRGTVRAVDGISLTLERPGEALGIVGESGSGKSTLALAIMRMLPPNIAHLGGDIRLQGETISRLSTELFRRQVRWRQIALVPQGASSGFNPVVRVGEQIIEPLTVGGGERRRARREAEALLRRVGLPAEVYQRYPHELSGGMKQRAMIAAALIMNPVLLLLDEPTSALDVSVQAQVMNLLKELKEELGLAILFITHDIALASDLCDRMAVVYGGELAEVGSTAQILTAPAHPYTQKLLASIPRLYAPRMPEFIAGSPPDLADPPPGCRFHPRCPAVMARCRVEHPPVYYPAQGQAARCWLWDEG